MRFGSKGLRSPPPRAACDVTGSAPLVAILDYGLGNLHSARKGFERVGADAHLSADRGLIAEARGVVLPGVGAFGPVMTALRATGLDEAAHEVIAAGRPFFGICVGMQVLFADSEEAPTVSGLGVFDGSIRWITGPLKRPQMQWNILDHRNDHPLLTGLEQPAWVYFVHSLAAETSEDVIATCQYGADLVAAVARDNIWAVQFHPEKSSTTGLRILANFVSAAAHIDP